MTCLENFPNDLEPTIVCGTEIIEFGPVTALLTIIIGGPLVSYVLRIVRRLMSKYDYVDSGVENFLYRIISTALWLYVFLVAANALGINVTGNIAITFGLALLTFLLTNLTANKNYWAHIFWMPGVPIPMKILLMPIELLGVIIKPFSLLIRLYANMQAGHIVLMSLIGLMFIFNNWLGSSLSFLLAFAISLIELLVAALQAYIFTMLSALYFGFAVEEHHDEAH